MLTTIEIGGEPFAFSAAHASLHGGEFEPLHGHTFTLTLRLHGEAGEDGMIADFRLIKKALAEVIAPLRRRTLMPADAPGVSSWHEDGQVLIVGGARRFSLPAADVVMLPLVNTTTEAIAAHLASQFVPYVRDEPGVGAVELTLAEAAGTAATITVGLSGGGVGGLARAEGA